MFRTAVLLSCKDKKKYGANRCDSELHLYWEHYFRSPKLDMKSGNTCGRTTVKWMHIGEITISTASETCYITQEHFIIILSNCWQFPSAHNKNFCEHNYCLQTRWYNVRTVTAADAYNVNWKYAREFNKQFEKTVQGGTYSPLHLKETLHTLNNFFWAINKVIWLYFD